MEKTVSKLNFIFVLLVFIAILFLLFFVYAFKKQQEEQIIHQKILEEQLAKKEAEKKAEQKIYLMGKFDPTQKESFVALPEEYNIGGYKMYLRKETLDAFSKMKAAASLDGVILKIASATRNFEYQKSIWNNKWTGFTIVNGKNLLKSFPNELERFKKILEYSAVPGTSRHHWGTDLDINNANSEYFETKEGKKVYEWLIKNASTFGFCEPYNLKGTARLTGYNEERWHWSYVPLAKTFLQDYKNLIKEEDINGFNGDVYVSEQDLINDYVLSINPECL